MLYNAGQLQHSTLVALFVPDLVELLHSEEYLADVYVLLRRCLGLYSVHSVEQNIEAYYDMYYKVFCLMVCGAFSTAPTSLFMWFDALFRSG